MAQRAPGKSYRKGITLMEIFKMFPNDDAAEKWFIDVRWPDGVHCPHCGSTRVMRDENHPRMPFRCQNYKECGKHFSVKTKTVMANSKLGCQIWAVAAYLLTTNLKSVSSMKLHRDFGITYKTAWTLSHKIRKSFEQEDQNFNGIVEADESCFGGLEKNKHADKKLHAGRGAVGKKAVAGIKDRETNQVVAKTIDNAKRKTLHDFIGDNADEGSTVCTDDFKSYENMQGYEHRTVKHSVGEYVDAEIHINGMESFWSVLKRAHKGTFHKISHKRLQRYVNEFAGRHNIRSKDTIDQMQSIVRGMVGKQLAYKDLVA